MELFNKAKAVRLLSHHDKYLLAEQDEESVRQDSNGSSRNACWTIEFVEGGKILHLKSCYGRYLTATNTPFLFGMTGNKVLQTTPRILDSSVEWEPIRDGFHVKLKTRYGNFLRANGGLPPWRNSVTHDIPHRTATQDWVLWEIQIMEIQVELPPKALHQKGSKIEPWAEEVALSSSDGMSPKLSDRELHDSFHYSPPRADGRIIYFTIADENGNIDDSTQSSFTFKGTSVLELTSKLEEETGFNDITVCFHSPVNGDLYPLRLPLPPGNVTRHVVVVKSSSKLAKQFRKEPEVR